MAIRSTLQIGHRDLQKKKIAVKNFRDDKVLQVIEDLIDTMRKEGLVGIAAHQIGEDLDIFVTEPRKTETRPENQADELRIYINSKIIEFSQEKSEIYEGCGSVISGQLFAPVERPKEIIIEAYDKNGQKFRLRCDGILARIIQHESDHLNGSTFIERVSDFKKAMDREHYVLNVKNLPEYIANSEITKIVCEVTS